MRASVTTQSTRHRAPSVARECAAQQREFIHEMLGFVRHYAELGQSFAALGDDAGTLYAVEKMAVYVREVVKAKIELIGFEREAS